MSDKKELRVKLPIRSRRYGVGKEIGGAVYLHRQYEHCLGTVIEKAKTHLPADFDYVVVKYHIASGYVSFLHSPDFDFSHEPTVGEGWLVYPDGNLKHFRQQADPFVYHHKWLFVTDDYLGFDTSDSQIRSMKWMALSPPVDFTRIGRKSYWESFVIPRV